MVINSINTACLLFAMLGIGLLMCRLGWLKGEHKLFLTKFIVNVCVPGMCVSNLLGKFDRAGLLSSGWQLLGLYCTMAIMLVLSIALSKIMKVSSRRHGVFVCMCGLTNAIFIGLPVCRGIFGEAAIPYVMIYYFVNTSLFWGFCNPLIQHSCMGKVDGGIKERLIRIFSPPLVTFLLCVIAILFDFKAPEIVLNLGSYFGACVTPLSMIVVARVIYDTGLKTLHIDRDMIAVILMRFTVSPVISILVSLFLGVRGLPMHVFAVQAALPIMMQCLLSSEAYGGDTKYAATGIIVTTLIGLGVLPLLILIMSGLGL